MREHHAFRTAGGAAGIRQRGEIQAWIDGHGRWLGRMALQQRLQPVQPGRRGHFGLFAEQALQRRQVFVDARQHREVELGARLLDFLVQDVLADDGARPAVLELVAHFVTGVDGADRRHHRAALQRGEVGDDELRAVEEVERDALALLQPQARERASQPVGRVAQLAVGDVAPVEHHGHAVGGACRGLVECLRHRFERHLDVGRHAGLVVREPGTRQVDLGCALQLSCSHAPPRRRF